MTTRKKDVGTLLRNARTAKRLSMRALADTSGVDYSVISRIETGAITEPDPKKLQALAEALDLAPEDLFAAAGYPMPLPEVRMYLRAKYGVSDSVAQELEGYFRRRIEREKGGRRGKRDQ